MATDNTQKPDGTGYSKTHSGEIGTDGVQRDWNGNVVPLGIDDTLKAEYARMAAGPQIRILPSENDIISGNTGVGAHQGQVYVNPNDGSDQAAQVFKPGYAVESASDDGKSVVQKDAETATSEAPATQADASTEEA